jgi:hypothetical protein
LIRANSASSQVLEVFKNNNDHWLSQSNLQWLARLSGQQTSWALHYLKTIGLIEHVVLDERNPRSGKYKLVAASQGVTAKVAQQKPSMRDHGTPDGTR